ncbi:MAG TPA: Uma2 family endonuclease [Thermoanaerobaculia bacterium]|nr:Uma2 family endonuclease [Thermoanaerobaculia bacterium]
MAIPNSRQLLTVDEFQSMAEAGVFAEDERLELIRGEIVEMTPIGDPHALSVMMACDFLSDLKPRGLVSPQNPLRLPRQQSVPQPDVVLLRRRPDFKLRPPGPEDVFLVVEVSDSSLAYDRDVKIPLYAESGIPEAWLIDLKSKTIFVYRQPSPEGYREVNQYRRGEAISPEAFPEALFTVESILG